MLYHDDEVFVWTLVGSPKSSFLEKSLHPSSVESSIDQLCFMSQGSTGWLSSLVPWCFRCHDGCAIVRSCAIIWFLLPRARIDLPLHFVRTCAKIVRKARLSINAERYPSYYVVAYLLKYVIVRVKERLKERYYAGKTVVQQLYNGLRRCTTRYNIIKHHTTLYRVVWIHMIARLYSIRWVVMCIVCTYTALRPVHIVS